MQHCVDDEASALIDRIEQRADLDQVRRDMALLILRCLAEKKDTLNSWEKMQFEMAIALLPTYWLRLAASHTRLAMEPPADHLEMSAEMARDFESITCEELVLRVVNYLK